jgi:hypothetical protein
MTTAVLQRRTLSDGMRKTLRVEGHAKTRLLDTRVPSKLIAS